LIHIVHSVDFSIFIILSETYFPAIHPLSKESNGKITGFFPIASRKIEITAL